MQEMSQRKTAQEMNENEQRIAIAEFCGAEWRLVPADRHFPDKRRRFLLFVHLYNLDGTCDLEKADGNEPLANTAYMWKEGCIPDYLNNLNAIHDAWRTLIKKDLLIQFNNHLRFIVRRDGYQEATVELLDALVLGATAPQRAEALLRTIGKWKSTP